MYNREVKFVDADNCKAVIECEIKERINGGEVFTASGSYNGSSGQCLDSINPLNEAQKKLIALWEEWHLNDMHAGTEKQEELLKANENDYVKWKQEGVSHYDWAVDLLTRNDLLIDDGYKYGTAWLCRELPEDFERDLDELLDEIEELEKERKGEEVITEPDMKNATEEEVAEFWNMILEETGYDGRDAELLVAICEIFGLTKNDLGDIEIDGTRCIVQGEDYLCGDEDEMDKLWDEEMDNYIDECILPEIDKHYHRYFDREAFKEDAQMDGRAHSLNRYDGGEESTTVNGTTYYLYKQ